MNVREFWLVNSKGKELKLTDKGQPIFLREPTGLGFSSSFETVTFGMHDKVETYQFNFEPITGELVFFGSDIKQIYQNYFEFMQFIAYSPLHFYYRPPNMMDSFFCTVRIAKVEKTEIKEDVRALTCPIEFKRETFWELGTPKELNLKNTTTGGSKSYPLTRPYRYGRKTLSNITIINNSVCSSPFSIEVIGKCTNLQYSLFDEDFSQYGAGKILGTYDYFYINSDDLNEQLILKNGDEIIENAFNMQDLTVGNENFEVTFLKLKSGKSYLRINAGNDFDGKVIVKWSDYYVSL